VISGDPQEATPSPLSRILPLETEEGTEEEDEPSEPEESDGEGPSSDSDSDSSEDDMPDIIFKGKASEIPGLLTHCTVHFLSKKKKYADDDEAKSGYLASTFRDGALLWLTKKLENEPKLLEDYDDFTATIRENFQASEQVQKQQAESAIRALRQKSSAQNYALLFEPLAETLGYNDSSKRASFIHGLKPEVRKQLAGSPPQTTYQELRNVAVAIDENLFSLRQTRPRKSNRKGPGKPDKRAN